MADIELVIKMDEEDYKIIKHNIAVDNPLCPIGEKEMVTLVANGTPLPKGHGRIGDLDVLKKDMLNYHDDCAKTSEYTRLGFETAIAVVENAKPIIEADKGE